MKILACALVGLIIFVSQPGTVILVGDVPLRVAENCNHASFAGAFSGVGVGPFLDELIVLPESPEAIMHPNTTEIQLVGARRGPVK